MTSPPRTAEPTHGAARAAPHASLFSQWRWWLPVALLSLALSFTFQDPFAGDWDALDYTVLAVNGWEPSSMLLGRMLYIFTNRAAFLITHALFGLPAEKAYLLFKYMVIAQAPLATTALWALARELSGSARAATVAALMLALSPYYVVYGGRALVRMGRERLPRQVVGLGRIDEDGVGAAPGRARKLPPALPLVPHRVAALVRAVALRAAARVARARLLAALRAGRGRPLRQPLAHHALQHGHQRSLPADGPPRARPRRRRLPDARPRPAEALRIF